MLIARRISVFLLVTLVYLGAAFGISLGVYEWRESEQPKLTEKDEIPAASGPSLIELDAQRCVAALQAAGAANQPERDLGRGFSSPGGIPKVLTDAVKQYCR